MEQPLFVCPLPPSSHPRHHTLISHFLTVQCQFTMYVCTTLMVVGEGVPSYCINTIRQSDDDVVTQDMCIYMQVQEAENV